MHGDKAEFSKRDSLLTTSIQSCLAQGETRDIKHLHWSCPSSVCTKEALPWKVDVDFDEYELTEDTLEELWNVSRWDFTVCLDGVFSGVDHNKKKFTGKQAWRGQREGCQITLLGETPLLWGILGDMEFHVYDLGCPSYSSTATSSGGICVRCPADTGDYLWNHNDKNCMWRAKLYRALVPVLTKAHNLFFKCVAAPTPTWNPMAPCTHTKHESKIGKDEI